MNEEIWKDIDGCNYKVSSKGTVFSYHRYKTMKQRKDKGFFFVTLCIDGVQLRRYVHVLMAKMFIPNPKQYNTVKHINGDITDNRVENLKWCNTYKKEKKLNKKIKNSVENISYRDVQTPPTFAEKQKRKIEELEASLKGPYPFSISDKLSLHVDATTVLTRDEAVDLAHWLFKMYSLKPKKAK